MGQLLLIYWNTRNIEHVIEHDIDSAIKWSLYTFDIHEIYSRFDEYLAIYKQMKNLTVLVCNIRPFFVSFLWGGKFLTSLDDSRILGNIALEQSEALALNGMAIMQTPLLGFGNDLWYLPVTLP